MFNRSPSVSSGSSAKVQSDAHDVEPTRMPAGRSGEGASGAMAQIRHDRRAESPAWTDAEKQIRTLWHQRTETDRNFAGVRTLAEWLVVNAPELLQGRAPGGIHEYLLGLLNDETDDSCAH